MTRGKRRWLLALVEKRICATCRQEPAWVRSVAGNECIHCMLRRLNIGLVKVRG